MALENYSFLFNTKTMYLMTFIIIGVNVFAFPNLLNHPDMKLNDLSMLIHDNPSYASNSIITKKEGSIEISPATPSLDNDNKKENIKEEKVANTEEKPVEKTEDKGNLKPLVDEKEEKIENKTEKKPEETKETEQKETEPKKEEEKKETEPKKEEEKEKEIAAINPSEESKNTKLDHDIDNETEEPAGISSCKFFLK